MKISMMNFVSIDRSFAITLVLISCLICSSCKSFVEIPPPETSLTTSAVFMDDATAEAAMVSVYISINTTGFDGGPTSLSWLSALSSDELRSYYTDYREAFATNELTPETNGLSYRWNHIYHYIYSVNAVLDGVQSNPNVSEPIVKMLQGEALFVRALMYFYLVNFWGEVPLVTGTDYRTNAMLRPASVSEVYQQIVADLSDAKHLLETSYRGPLKIRPNRLTASALLARVYLYAQEWEKAAQESSEVIDAGVYILEQDLNATFLNTSRETIWQTESCLSPWLNTDDGYYFILSAKPPTGRYQVTLHNGFVEEAFENDDLRKQHWIGTYTDGNEQYYYPFKYKIPMANSADDPKTEYPILFRLAEQYLIRAEAQAHLGDIDGATRDLDEIRKRAGLKGIAESIDPSNQQALLLAIEQERRLELFTEWCHRWFDLKRTGRVDAVLSPIKPGWQPTDALYPIPIEEIERNPNMGAK